MIVDPGPLVYRGSLTATHTARAVSSQCRVKARDPSRDVRRRDAPGRCGSAGNGRRHVLLSMGRIRLPL